MRNIPYRTGAWHLTPLVGQHRPVPSYLWSSRVTCQTVGYEAYNDAGGRIQLLHREWELLLELATRQGWEPVPDRDYAEGGQVTEVEARHMTAALKRALPDIPGFYADGLTDENRPTGTRTKPQMLKEGGLSHERPGDEQGDPFAYFSGGNRRTLEQFIEIAAAGFEIRPLPGFGGEF